MNRLLFFSLALFLALTVGCEPSSTAPMAPANAAEVVIPEGAVRAWIDVEGVPTLAYISKGGPNAAVRVLYICDGPMIGPIQDGHCRSDGSDCAGDPLPDTRTGYAAPKWIGDPTADDAGDPDIGNDISNADADGIVVR